MLYRLLFAARRQCGRFRRTLAMMIAAGALALSGFGAQAQEAGALVLDINGPSEPETGAFEELAIGATIKLGPDTEITVAHYASCREVSLRGGTVLVQESVLRHPGARVLHSAATECPMPVTVHKSDLIGAGVVLRSVRPRPKVSATPSFLIAVGDGKYTELRIQIGTEVLVTRAITGARVDWDARDRPLAPGEYTVVLSGEEQRMHAAQVRVTAAGAGLIILRP